MAKSSIADIEFCDLITSIRQETSSCRKKFELFYYSKGNFTAEQAVQLLNSYKTAQEKVKVVKVLEKRLCRMRCCEAAEILKAVSITDNDRLLALECLKRTLIDHGSTEGMEYILAAFEFPNDKMKAMGILHTVSNYVSDKMSAGGHQGYAALGGLYTQNWPLMEHLYGPVEEQIKRMPGHGEPAIPVTAQPGRVPSLYTSHPTYQYMPDKSINEVRGYPGARPFPDMPGPPDTYPAGAPPLCFQSGAPAPTGFEGLKSADHA